jgi:hypothetical protein
LNSSDGEDDEEVSNAGVSDADEAVTKGFSKKRNKVSTGFKGDMLKLKIAPFIEDLHQKCWKCIQQETGAVITSPHMWEQEAAMLRKMLRLDNCSVEEIVLFRACNDWAERQCRKVGLTITAEHKREVIGAETINLIRFPTMSIEELQWEVVPTGLLDYADVQSLMHSMTARVASFGSSYNSRERGHKVLMKRSRAFENNPAQPVYSSVADCPIDRILGAELLKGFLKQTIDALPGAKDAAPLDSGSRASSPTPSISHARLPPITPKATPRGSVGMLSNPASPSSAVSPSNVLSPKKKAQIEMVMGSRIDAEDEQDGIMVHDVGKCPQPSDFYRIAPGLYKFRDDRLIEIWLTEGEAMVINHGTHPALAYLPGYPMDVESARTKLGIPVGKSQSKGGVPLASFLCRQ